MPPRERDAYALAVALVVATESTGAAVASPGHELGDRLRRTALRALIGFVEGCCGVRRKERQAGFARARAATLECAALLDVLGALELAQAAELEPARRCAWRLSSQLARRVRAPGGDPEVERPRRRTAGE